MVEIYSEYGLDNKYGLEQYVLVFKQHVIKVLHFGKKVPDISYQREYILKMKNLYGSLCVETELLEVLCDDNRISYCLIQEKCIDRLADVNFTSLSHTTLQQIRKYYLIAIKARILGIGVDTIGFQGNTQLLFNILQDLEDRKNEPNKFIRVLKNGINRIENLISKYDVRNSTNIMLDEYGNVKIVDICATENLLNPLHFLGCTNDGVIYQKEIANKTKRDLLSKGKSVFWKYLDVCGLLINLLGIQKLIFQKGRV